MNAEMNKVLIVDDERKIRNILGEILAAGGFVPLEAESGAQALEVFKKDSPATVLLDLKMPGMSGIETMQELKKADPCIPIIIVTAHGDIPTAVESIKLGAYDFILKPPDFDALLMSLNRALEKYELEREVRRLNRAMEASFQDIFGKSPSIQTVIKQIRQIAKSDFSVIIQGETGTGKSFFSRVIHNLSSRSAGPFVTVDMGAIPETLIESELFGYEKGAFTGAERRKKGFFENAGNGTIFIDELENMSPYLQSKLLRVVEEREVCTLGSSAPLSINTRIIAATNTDISQLVLQKNFREDLFYRLGEFIITIPPLRERLEDIPFLAQKFLRGAAEELGKPVQVTDAAAMESLLHYSWPGNVRELKNVMRRLALVSESYAIGKEQVKRVIGNSCSGRGDCSALRGSGGPCASLKEAETAAISQALTATKGNKRKAASILQIDYSTLLRKLKQYRIQL